jgi:glucose/arabinose dehydrogenase
MLRRVIFIFLLLVSSLSSKELNLKVDEVLNGFDLIWSIAFIDEDRLIINEKDGDIFLHDFKKNQTTKIKNSFDILHKGQGGLLDVQVSPNYKKDKWLYFTYVKDINSQGATTLIRAKLKGSMLIELQELLVSKSRTNTSAHFGSRITFDNKGHVFFSIGDRGLRNNSQNLNNHAGTIIRLNMDGSTPKDNPFINNPDALDEVYSYGHRNPQGIFFDEQKNRLFAIEHGPRGGDEINLIKKGANYGWPIISFGKEYWSPLSVGEGTHKEGMENPLKVYIPSIAPSSLLVYSGKLFKEFKGNLFSGALKLRHLNRIVLNENGEPLKEVRYLEDLGERIRDIIESPKGYIFISTDSGKVLKLSLR